MHTPFHFESGLLSVSVTRPAGVPTITFGRRDVPGKVVHEFTATAAGERK